MQYLTAVRLSRALAKLSFLHFVAMRMDDGLELEGCVIREV